MTVLFRRCAYWSNTVYKRIMACRWPVYIVNWTLANKLQLKFNRNSYICIQENAFEILSGPQWVNMNQVFMLVYSRSVTMPGLVQNWSLFPTLGRFRRKDKVVLTNYGVKKKIQGNMCWADIGSISVRRQSEYLNIIIKTNRNVPQRNATIHFCPPRNQITRTDRSMMHGSLWTDVNRSSLLKVGCDEAGGFVAQMK